MKGFQFRIEHLYTRPDLESYEHGYHRTLISKYTLIGVLSDDKKTIDKTAINPRLTNATWHIMCGGTGSGFNA